MLDSNPYQLSCPCSSVAGRMPLVRIPPREAPFFLGKKAVLGVVELFAVPCLSTSFWWFSHTYVPVCDSYACST